MIIYFIITLLLQVLVVVLIPGVIINLIYRKSKKVRTIIILPFFILNWLLQAYLMVLFYERMSKTEIWICDLCVFVLPVVSFFLSKRICQGRKEPIPPNQESIISKEDMKDDCNPFDCTEKNVSIEGSETTHQQSHRKGWRWSVAALIAWIPFLFIGAGASMAIWEEYVTFVLAAIGFVMHIIFYMNSKHIAATGSLIIAIYNLLAISFSLCAQLFACFYDWPSLLSALIIMLYLPIFICYLLHLFKPYRNTPKSRKACSPRAIIRSKERAYRKIAKFYKYKQKGIMTEEEFEKFKTDILSTIQ